MASLLFDTDANMRIGRWLEGRDHSLTSVPRLGLARATDAEILHFAGRHGLVLVTHNERDFVDLHRIGAILEHSGILVLPQIAADAVANIAAAVDWLVTSRSVLRNALYRLRSDAIWECWDDELRWQPL